MDNTGFCNFHETNEVDNGLAQEETMCDSRVHCLTDLGKGCSCSYSAVKTQMLRFMFKDHLQKTLLNTASTVSNLANIEWEDRKEPPSLNSRSGNSVRPGRTLYTFTSMHLHLVCCSLILVAYYRSTCSVWD